MHVGSLSVYPLKSSRRVLVPSAEVELCGLTGDRRWVVVDLAGGVVTARDNDRLLQVIATSAVGMLTLEAPASTPVEVPVPAGGAPLDVSVSRMPRAADAGDRAASWLSDVLHQPVRLAWQDDPGRRTVSEQHGGMGGEPLNLSDAGPVLLTTTSSLDQLNTWIAEQDPAAQIPMERFRPNIVVEGAAEAFEEDRWRRIRIGDVEYRQAEVCDRCVITTIDPATLTRGPEPLRTLARHRRWDGKTWFGIRLIPLHTGVIQTGDPVTVIEHQ